jgi:hypothetical protein
MSTAAQHAANIRNAALSTGPRTPEGKAASSRNALKFGLTSKQVLLPHEDPAEFDALESTLLEQIQPADDGERLLVNDIAVARWKIRRIELARAAWMDFDLSRRRMEDRNLATAWTLLSPEIQRFDKYAAAERRVVENAWRKLRLLQQERRDREKAAAEAARASLQNKPKPTSAHPVEQAFSHHDIGIDSNLPAGQNPATAANRNGA